VLDRSISTGGGAAECDIAQDAKAVPTPVPSDIPPLPSLHPPPYAIILLSLLSFPQVVGLLNAILHKTPKLYPRLCFRAELEVAGITPVLDRLREESTVVSRPFRLG
jgi:hypothetical protein